MVPTDTFTATSGTRDRTRWITLTGDLDMATMLGLSAEFDRAGDSRSRSLVLDLSRLTFIDCIGLRAIIAFARRARAGGWRLRIVSPAPSVARIFALTDTAQSLPLTEPMTDDQVRALLASQPHSETLPHPAATVAILRRHVEDATDDLGAVERWIAGQSGQRHIGAPTKSLTHRTGSARPHYDGPFPYYIIPAEALVEPVLSPPNLVRLDERIGAIAHGHGSYASGAKPA